MLFQRLIPSLLLRKGRLVKGTQFSDHRDAGRAETTARAHNAQGADELLLLDIDASREKLPPDYTTIRQVAQECFMPLTVGGGVRTLEHASNCMDAGADKLFLNTAAIDNPEFITALAHKFGSQALVLGVDIAGSSRSPRLFDHRMNKTLETSDPLGWIKEAIVRGAGEIRLMSVDHEGTRNGFDLSLYQLMRKHVKVPVILEGGAGTPDHLMTAFRDGVEAVATGTMLVFSDNNIVRLKQYLASNGCNLRAG